MCTYVWLPITPSGCRVMSNHMKVNYTHHHITGWLTVSMYKNTIFCTFQASQKWWSSLSLSQNAALLLSASCHNNGRSCALNPFGCSINWRGEREEQDGCGGRAVVKLMVWRMARFISGRWVGSLDRSKNGGWAHQPNVYCIVVGGKKRVPYIMDFKTRKMSKDTLKHIL